MTDSRPAVVIVLAAGQGTRMKSATAKVLHTMCGRTLLERLDRGEHVTEQRPSSSSGTVVSR